MNNWLLNKSSVPPPPWYSKMPNSTMKNILNYIKTYQDIWTCSWTPIEKQFSTPPLTKIHRERTIHGNWPTFTSIDEISRKWMKSWRNSTNNDENLTKFDENLRKNNEKWIKHAAEWWKVMKHWWTLMICYGNLHSWTQTKDDDLIITKVSPKWVIAIGFRWKSVQIGEKMGQEVDSLGLGSKKRPKRAKKCQKTGKTSQYNQIIAFQDQEILGS